MLGSIRQWDRFRLMAVGLVAVSLLLIAAGAVAIALALTTENVQLPSEGTISDITGGDSQDPTAGAPSPAVEPAGPPPVRMVIPRLYIDAPIVREGLDASNIPAVPERPDQVAWYDFSATPGSRSNAVFAGHVDWQTADKIPIPGVFYRLKEMKIGDVIEITRDDGSRLQYRVTGNVATPYNDPNVVRVMQATGKDVITVITCGGTWLRDRSSSHGGNYSHRVIVRAELVTGAVRAAGSAP